MSSIRPTTNRAQQVFRADVVAQRVERIGLVLQLFGEIGKVLHLAAIDRLEQSLACGA